MSLRTAHQPPQPPNMLPNGLPQIIHLRTSHARQVQYDPHHYPPDYMGERATEPVGDPPHIGILRRILRGVLAHWLPLAFGVLLLIGLYTGYQQWIAPAWGDLQAQWHTGDGRIVQLDANVGHGGVSHFIAQYYDGRIVVIEMPLNNPAHITTYTLLALTANNGKHQDLTLFVQDENHDGRLDLVIQEGNSGVALVLYNTGSGFTTSEEQP